MGMYKIKDLTSGVDCRGDFAFFIEERHFVCGGLDATVKELHKNSSPTFFRVIKKGEETSSHGWLDRGEIVQWG